MYALGTRILGYATVHFWIPLGIANQTQSSTNVLCDKIQQVRLASYYTTGQAKDRNIASQLTCSFTEVVILDARVSDQLWTHGTQVPILDPLQTFVNWPDARDSSKFGRPDLHLFPILNLHVFSDQKHKAKYLKQVWLLSSNSLPCLCTTTAHSDLPWLQLRKPLTSPSNTF